MPRVITIVAQLDDGTPQVTAPEPPDAIRAAYGEDFTIHLVVKNPSGRQVPATTARVVTYGVRTKPAPDGQLLFKHIAVISQLGDGGWDLPVVAADYAQIPGDSGRFFFDVWLTDSSVSPPQSNPLRSLTSFIVAPAAILASDPSSAPRPALIIAYGLPTPAPPGAVLTAGTGASGAPAGLSWQTPSSGGGGIPFVVGTDASRPAPTVGSFLNSDEGYALFNWDGARWVMADGRPSLHDQVLATQSSMLWSFWQLNDTSGFNAADASGHGRPGAYDDVTLNHPSLIRRSVKPCAGPHTIAQVSSGIDFPLSGNWSVAWWLYGDALDTATIFSSGDGAITLVVSLDGSAVFSFSGDPFTTIPIPAGTFGVGKLTHVAVGADTSPNVSIYVNRILVGQAQFGSSFSDSAIVFGLGGGFAAQAIAAWTAMITPAQIISLYAAGGNP